jgi:hypothetical protein
MALSLGMAECPFCKHNPDEEEKSKELAKNIVNGQSAVQEVDPFE